jgi:histidinol-phosphate phosphatase family protein
MTESVDYSIVIPTVGRSSLETLLQSLGNGAGPLPREVIVVDDRPDRTGPLRLPRSVEVVPTHRGGRGPAAARNTGWHLARGEWVVFLDDDVEVRPDWCDDLAADLAGLRLDVGGSQGRIVVPQAVHRRLTDWERNVDGLTEAIWATADLAYRRDVLEEVGGFDERFHRAFREDADFGLRVIQAGYVIVRGERIIDHPVRPAGWAVSIRLQAGNADDALMRWKHGPDWRPAAHAEAGRTGRHLMTVGSAAVSLVGARSGRRALAAAGLAGWAAGTGELAWSRVAPGPKTGREIATMLATSAALPPAAVYHGGRGWTRVAGEILRQRRTLTSTPTPRFPYPTVRNRWRFGPIPRHISGGASWRPRAVLLDRDGTLIADTGYPRRPDQVRLMPGVRMALTRIRQAGLATAVITNQSGVGRGLVTPAEMRSVNERIEALTGPFDVWSICCHRPDDGCDCRKPAPGLVYRAAHHLGLRPADCVVVGDIGADVQAAGAAGARSILVPTTRTRPAEVQSARQVAPDLLTAVDLLVGGRC